MSNRKRTREFEDTKEVLRGHKWKDRQHNGQQNKKNKTNNDLPITL
jgi:hypothetical protein